MTADKVDSSDSGRQKVVAVVFLLILIFLVWMIKGMISGGSSPAPATPIATKSSSPSAVGSPSASNSSVSASNAAASPSTSQQSTPHPNTDVPQQAAMTPREAELMRLQEATEAKYIAAMNELQILKVNQAIAETNKAIATAKLDTVTAQKNVVDMLSGKASSSMGSYAQNLAGIPINKKMVGSIEQPASASPQAPAPVVEVSYSVISVSQLQSKWNAVLGYQGNLFSVAIGDKLPPDGSTVISIDKSGVILDKNGQKKKFSMVPII